MAEEIGENDRFKRAAQGGFSSGGGVSMGGAASMGGAWSNYPYFSSGNIIITSGMEGLFVVRTNDNLIP